MKKLLCLFVLATCCALFANGLFFKKKLGCDAKPCKNKGDCIPDPKNATLFTCACKAGFFGPKCESKGGCSKNPCRKGVCIEDPKNPANFTCKCNDGFVGVKCDTANGCAKNPCKNGKCSLDSSNKPVCTCDLGWSSKYCDKRNCTITEFKGKHISKSSQKVLVDESISKKFEDLDGLAKLCHVKLHIEKAFTLHPDPKYANELDTKDKTNPAFFTGQAARFTIHDENDKLACNDICLGKIPIPHPGAKCFVDGLHAINWKWSILSPNEVSTNHHIGNTLGYNRLRQHHQVGCREKKF